MDEVLFDVPARAFTVTMKPGSSMSRAELEAFMVSHNKATKESFEVVWDAAGAASSPDAQAHAFVLPTLEGGSFDFGEVLGERPAVLAFWASWCAPCVLEAPHLARLHEELGDRVVIAGVSIDEPRKHGKLRALVKRLALPYPVPLDPDGAVFAKFNPGGSIPYTIVVDTDGAVTYVSTNFEEGDEATLRAAVFAVSGR